MARLATAVFLLLSVMLSTQVQANESVKSFASSVADHAIAIIKDASLDQTAKQTKLESLFKKSVDIPWVARFVLGKHWRLAKPEQQTAYLKNYEAFLIKNYTSRFTEYSDQDYRITKVREENSEEYLLTMELLNTNEPNVLMDYRIMKNGSGYKIIDIVVEGVSMITTQRSEFNSVVSRNGLDFLINALEKKSAG